MQHPQQLPQQRPQQLATRNSTRDNNDPFLLPIQWKARLGWLPASHRRDRHVIDRCSSAAIPATAPATTTDPAPSSMPFLLVRMSKCVTLLSADDATISRNNTGSNDFPTRAHSLQFQSPPLIHLRSIQIWTQSEHNSRSKTMQKHLQQQFHPLDHRLNWLPQ